MAIDVKVSEEKKEESLDYPLLMKSESTGVIVLMRKAGSGVVVKPNKCDSLGDCSNGWNMEQFKPFHGTVWLSNK